MNSTPSTWASIMRFTAFTPAPPTPTTRSTGSVGCAGCLGTNGSGSRSGSCWVAGTGSRSRMFSGMSWEKTDLRRSSGLGHALVAAPALLALGPALLALLRAASGLGPAPARSVPRSAGVRSGSLCAWGSGTWRVTCGAGPPSGSGRPSLGSVSGLRLRLLLGPRLRLLLGRTSVVLLRLAEELRQGTLAHARPLTACHSPGPPPLADGRRRPPYRRGRTSAPTCP